MEKLRNELRKYFQSSTAISSKYDKVEIHLDDLPEKLQKLEDVVPKAIFEIKISYSSYKVVLLLLPYWHVARAWINFWSLYFWDVAMPVLFSLAMLIAMVGHYEVRATWTDILTKLFGP